jgi:hypothetical protein
MSNKVIIMMGYTVSDNPNVVWDDTDFVAEIQTNGTDTNGYQFQETLGVSRNEYDELCIFKGSTDRARFERCSAITMSNNGYKLSENLFKLAEKLKELGE